MTETQTRSDTEDRSIRRRSFVSTAMMIGGIVIGYGAGLFHFFQYLVPLRSRGRRRKMFVGTLAELPVGGTRSVKAPTGEEITLARVSDDKANPAAGFKALSTKCPHLGCKVHWVENKREFFCPCHNGVFDKDGLAVSGPPAKEGKNLSQYEVQVEKKDGWVFVIVPQRNRYGA
ncbi:MAG TPA: Rieske (2Fe-2S) protein [Phycisphaerae bacterium]|nr:Rieske (2Fe-2S) protein [Phycisphaerae bacterium]HRW55524.1 Rieske (2Fe-2S) protein [Phycisphaerae bacterium]